MREYGSVLNPIEEESQSEQVYSPDPVEDAIRKPVKRESRALYSSKIESSPTYVDTVNLRSKQHHSHGGHDRKSSYTSQAISPFKLIPHPTLNQTSDMPHNTLAQSFDSINFHAINRQE